MATSMDDATRSQAGLFDGLEMGVGTWQWGDMFVWQYGRGNAAGEVRAAFEAALAAGLTFFDTAEMYGLGRSERFLGEFIHAPGGTQVRVRVATKFATLPWRQTAGSVVRALRGSLKRLGLPAVDLYQIHWPVPLTKIETLMSGLADAVDAGLTHAVGVSNYSLEQTERAHAALAKRGLALASNQVHFSLLNRQVERVGLLAHCAELSVRVIAYSPLEMGMLSGKYTAARSPSGSRARRYSPNYLGRIQPLIGRLRQMGEAHAGPDGARNSAQVALNWTVCKGTVPIPGAKNAQQVQQNAGGVGWRLTADEVAELDELSQAVQLA